MTDTSNLASRIDAEFTALGEKFKKAQAEQLQAYKEREKRIQRLGQLFNQLREVWRPRLEVLLQKFGDHVKVTPRLVTTTREATFAFQSKLARIELKFSAFTDTNVTRLILSYDLEIVPILMNFDKHSEVEFPLDAVDPEAVGRWFDDRIVSFVKTYLSLHENDYYLKDQMVEDPVAGVRFPKFAASATLDWKGSTYYFIGEETRREFAKKNEIALA